MDTDGRFPTPTTRRTIVATGAKLAYTAPLVATSLRLDRPGAAAMSRPPGVCPAECSFQWCSLEDPEGVWVYTDIIQCFGLDSLQEACFSCSGCLSGGRPTVLEIVPTANHCGGNPELIEERAVCVDSTTREIVCDAEGGTICRRECGFG
jgi:hypothetical protein